MIVAMTKYSFLVYHKEYNQFLDRMRELGLLHVIQKQAGALEEGSELQAKLQLSTRFDKALKYMVAHLAGDHSKCAPADAQHDAAGKVAHLEFLLEERSKSLMKQAALDKEIDRMKLWGDFKWESIYDLRDAGYIVRFWSASERNFHPEWIEKYNAIRIGIDGSSINFITLTESGEMVEIESAERVRLPKESLHDLIRNQKETNDEQLDLDAQLAAHTYAWYNTIEAGSYANQEEIDYSKVVLNTQGHVENKVFLLEGWVPTENEKEINAFLDKEGIHYEAERATKESPAPIKLSNNRFARLFHPITELYDMPAYGEMDLTPFFAPFFVMFFGLCLGDSGYGVLLFLIGIIAYYKVKPSLKPVMTLLAILGFGTIVFGLISGTFFGIQLLEVNWPWIQNAKKMMLSSDDLFYFSLMVGVFQILFGMVIKAVGQTKRFGFKNALSAWGWLIAIGGSVITYALEHFKMITPEMAKILFYVVGGLGAVGIFILNDVKRNPLINVGAGIWDSYNMASGLLGDILSYVRLFALGISGSVLGLVFNDLADKMSPDIPVVGFIVAAIILTFGHGMNIFMSGLGAFVHPMRLTFVEFYKNAGFEGGGRKYNPFARIKKKD